MSNPRVRNEDVEFINLETAASMKTGVRVTMSKGFPALYSECLKNICYCKNIPIIRVIHPNMGKDRKTGEDRQKRLFELTAQTSLPVMWYNDERPRSNWSEQLALCERIGTGPKLVPDNMRERAEMFGLCAIILAEDGMLWNSRIVNDNPLGRKYGYSKAASLEAPDKMAGVIKLVCDRLAEQKRNGSPYLVGNRLTAVDIYWATMSYNLLVPDEDFMPPTTKSQMMKIMFGNLPFAVEAVLDKAIVLEHREYILRKYCEVPVVLGGQSLKSAL